MKVLTVLGAVLLIGATGAEPLTRPPFLVPKPATELNYKIDLDNFSLRLAAPPIEDLSDHSQWQITCSSSHPSQDCTDMIDGNNL